MNFLQSLDKPMDQLGLHNTIDAELNKGPSLTSRDVIHRLISHNDDTRQYFYAQADEHWLTWLWENGFLDVVKQKTDDPTRYGYKTPELNYLGSVSTKAPEQAVKILLDEGTATNKKKFSPEVIDQFLRICSGLPAKQLKQVVPKIRNEGWPALMGKFNQWGFEYKEILETLVKAKDYDSVLVLAEAILAIRAKTEMSQSERKYTDDTPFYFSDLSDTTIFEILVGADDAHKEQALAISVQALRDAVLVGAKERDSEVFDIAEYHFLDVDFFKLELGQKERLSYREDVTNLAATVKELAEKVLGESCSEEDTARKIYGKYFQNLPNSQTFWRLQLFVLSLCPKVFAAQLKDKFFRVFDTEKYHELVSGAEYQTALAEGFSMLNDQDKQAYIAKVLDYFGVIVDDEQEQRWRKEYARRLLVSAFKKAKITNEVKRDIEKKLGISLTAEHKPVPSVQFDGQAHSVLPQAPEDPVWDGPVSAIVAKMKDEWTPEKMAKKYRNAPFHSPVGVEGVGERMKKEMEKRPIDFLQDAALFFDRKKLDPHYTYSYFRALYDLIREKNIPQEVDLSGVFHLMDEIMQSGVEDSFESKTEGSEGDRMLARWGASHELMADVLQGLLREDSAKSLVDFTSRRDKLLSIFSYLLQYEDPKPEDEKLPTAKMKVRMPDEKEYSASEPSHIAINSARGRAFEAFLIFVYRDGQRLKAEGKKIADDVKRLYEKMLKREQTQAIMFTFGRYLPSFYFRDMDWFKEKAFSYVFPSDKNKRDLFLAAWEGYLSNNLYEELFFDSEIQALYMRAVALSPNDYTKRKYSIELDEGIATHLALAFTYYEDFDFDHPLFKAFWNKQNAERHAKFIAFIGRSVISGDSGKARELLQTKSWSKKRIRDFWDWILTNKNDAKLLAEFGFWISATSEFFDDQKWLATQVRKTLKGSQGALDWEYGLIKSIVPLAEAAPSDTVEILRHYLIEGGLKSGQSRVPFSVDKEWFDAFKILYSNTDTKSATYKLINDLIETGGSTFWKLKEIVED